MRFSSNSFKLYGIFGFPLQHTLSPVMQEAAFQALGFRAFYLPFEVRREEFRRLMRRRSRLLLDGFNVTVPYKEEVLRYLDGLNPAARAIGAVNTVVRKGKRWIGFNTDGIGFIRSLEKEARFQPRGKSVLILGAGGSARGVAYALAERGAGQIIIANRTVSRLRKLVGQYRRIFPRVEFAPSPLPLRQRRIRLRRKRRRGSKVRREIDLVVNATSVGLKSDGPSLVSPKDFPRKTLFVDLIYSPAETRLLRLARESGHRTLNGLGMLVYQGTEAFRLWTGRRVPVEVMWATLEKEMNAR